MDTLSSRRSPRFAAPRDADAPQAARSREEVNPTAIALHRHRGGFMAAFYHLKAVLPPLWRAKVREID
jgi:hypothetical protein